MQFLKAYRYKIAAGLFALFYVAFYLCRPIYYTPYLGGVVGDNYRYVGNVVGPSIFTAQHLYFPFVPEKLFRLFIRLGIFNKRDPLFLEKAFPFFSLPSRLFALIGFGAFYRLLRRTFRPDQSLIGTLFLASSFGYWFWPLQSNAVGFLVPMAVVTLYAAVRAFDLKTPLSFAVAATALAFCFFTHISAAYLVGAMGIAIVLMAGRRILKGEKRFALNLCVFTATALAWMYVFLLCLKHQYGTQSLMSYAAVLSDTNTLGGWSFSGFVKLLFKVGLGVNGALLLGFIKTGGSGFLENFIIILQVGTALYLLIPALFSWDKIRSYFSNTAVQLAWAGLSGCLIGFALRATWFQYCSVMSGLTAFLFVSFVLAPTVGYTESKNRVVLMVLTLGCLFTNGLGSHRVFEGQHLNDNPVYRTYSALHTLTNGESAVLIADWLEYPYNFIAITSYYSAPGGVAEKTRWVENPSMENFAAAVDNAEHIFFAKNMRSAQMLHMLSDFSKKPDVSLPDFPRVSWWVRQKAHVK
jgi:hypothetical protein